jgi:perosamine synthetase
MSFEPGAAAAKGVIPLSVPELRGNEWKYVKECIDTNWVSSAGPFVGRFEEMVANFVGAKNGIATVSGTAALHVALLLAGVKPDDEVVMPALTFIAPANAIRYAGAWPVFMDVEPDHWQMDVRKLSDFLHLECRWTNGALFNASSGRQIKAILPVHILGHPCDMDPITELARKFELRVIEDATESLGAKYKDRMVGNLSDIGCFSFNGNKLITTGGGGMIVTNNDEWATRGRYLTTQAKDDPIEYVHNAIGFNYRLTNIQAAMGCAQIELIDDFVSQKRKLTSTYLDQLQSVPGIGFMKEATWARSAAWLFTVRIDPTRYGIDSRSVLKRLSADRIQARPLWQPLHRSKAHADSQAYCVEIADSINADALSLPSSVGLESGDQQRVTDSIRLGYVAEPERVI